MLEDGQLLEKVKSACTNPPVTNFWKTGTQLALLQAAVNVSSIQGTLTPERATTMSGRGRGIDPKGGQLYSAAALSLVYHPAHPFVPTLRADVRLFQVKTPWQTTADQHLITS